MDAVVIIQQPCPTYNNINTKDWYGGEDRRDSATGEPVPRVYKMDETGFDGVVHKPEEIFSKTEAALTKGQEWGDSIPTGVFYQNELISTYQERIIQRVAAYLQNPPARQVISDVTGKPVTKLSKMMDDLKVTG